MRRRPSCEWKNRLAACCLWNSVGCRPPTANWQCVISWLVLHTVVYVWNVAGAVCVHLCVNRMEAVFAGPRLPIASLCPPCEGPPAAVQGSGWQDLQRNSVVSHANPQCSLHSLDIEQTEHEDSRRRLTCARNIGSHVPAACF